MPAKTEKTKKIEIYNKKARFDYAIDESFEAGVVLFGNEIKAARSGRANISGAHVRIMHGEVYLINSIIGDEEDKSRSRKLLLKKTEIERLAGKTEEKGLTLVPLKMYFTRGKLKLEVGLGRGKKKFDKRETIKKREQERQIESDFLRKGKK
ncbi:MAG: SsrA-binding protein SmpB [Patescibacteria group bacterium]